MSVKRLPRPRDPVQLGKLIGDILTGQVEDRAPNRQEDQNKDQAAVALGRKGGLKGGKARMAEMTPKQRTENSPQGRKGPLGQIALNDKAPPQGAGLCFIDTHVSRLENFPAK